LSFVVALCASSPRSSRVHAQLRHGDRGQIVEDTEVAGLDVLQVLVGLDRVEDLALDVALVGLLISPEVQTSVGVRLRVPEPDLREESGKGRERRRVRPARLPELLLRDAIQSERDHLRMHVRLPSSARPIAGTSSVRRTIRTPLARIMRDLPRIQPKGASTGSRPPRT